MNDYVYIYTMAVLAYVFGIMYRVIGTTDRVPVVCGVLVVSSFILYIYKVIKEIKGKTN